MARPHSNPPLTWERLDELFEIYPAVGLLIWKKNTGKKRLIGKIAGERGHKFGYVAIGIDGAVYKRHRLIWFYVHRKWPDDDLDHVNGVRDEDWIDNLRAASRAQNTWNSIRPVTNKSGHKGVSWHSKNAKWRANIRANGRWHHLGLFDNIEDAILARKSAEQRLHEGFARNDENAVSYPSSHTIRRT